MTILCSCPKCRTPLQLRDDLAGKQFLCPKCKSLLNAPAEPNASDQEIYDSRKEPGASVIVPAIAASVSGVIALVIAFLFLHGPFVRSRAPTAQEIRMNEIDNFAHGTSGRISRVTTSVNFRKPVTGIVGVIFTALAVSFAVLFVRAYIAWKQRIKDIDEEDRRRRTAGAH